MSPIFAFLAVLMLLSVGFALYKAVTAFSGTVESPRYESLPPGSVVQDTPYTILKNSQESESTVRLSDQALVSVYSGSDEISKKVVEGNLSETDLVRYGMSSQEASRAVRNINSPGAIDVTSAPDLNSDSASEPNFSDNEAEIYVPFSYSLRDTGYSYDGTVATTWKIEEGIANLTALEVVWKSA